MSEKIKLKRPGMGVGDTKELSTTFEMSPFELYGRHHEVESVVSDVRVTRLAEGLHLDFEVRCEVSTTCDRTLEPTSIALAFGESEYLSGPNDADLYVEDWELDLRRYSEEALPSEVPMQVFRSGTEPVSVEPEENAVDPRWRGLDGLFASGF